MKIPFQCKPTIALVIPKHLKKIPQYSVVLGKLKFVLSKPDENLSLTINRKKRVSYFGLRKLKDL